MQLVILQVSAKRGVRWLGRCEVNPRASRLRRASTGARWRILGARSTVDNAHHPEKMGACVLSTIADRIGAYRPRSLPVSDQPSKSRLAQRDRRN